MQSCKGSFLGLSLASARERGWALLGEAGDDLRADTKGRVLALSLRKSLVLARTPGSLLMSIVIDIVVIWSTVTPILSGHTVVQNTDHLSQNSLCVRIIVLSVRM